MPYNTLDKLGIKPKEFQLTMKSGTDSAYNRCLVLVKKRKDGVFDIVKKGEPTKKTITKDNKELIVTSQEEEVSEISLDSFFEQRIEEVFPREKSIKSSLQSLQNKGVDITELQWKVVDGSGSAYSRCQVTVKRPLTKETGEKNKPFSIAKKGEEANKGEEIVDIPLAEFMGDIDPPKTEQKEGQEEHTETRSRAGSSGSEKLRFNTLFDGVVPLGLKTAVAYDFMEAMGKLDSKEGRELYEQSREKEKKLQGDISKKLGVPPMSVEEAMEALETEGGLSKPVPSALAIAPLKTADDPHTTPEDVLRSVPEEVILEDARQQIYSKNLRLPPISEIITKIQELQDSKKPTKWAMLLLKNRDDITQKELKEISNLAKTTEENEIVQEIIYLDFIKRSGSIDNIIKSLKNPGPLLPPVQTILFALITRKDITLLQLAQILDCAKTIDGKIGIAGVTLLEENFRRFSEKIEDKKMSSIALQQLRDDLESSLEKLNKHIDKNWAWVTKIINHFGRWLADLVTGSTREADHQAAKMKRRELQGELGEILLKTLDRRIEGRRFSESVDSKRNDEESRRSVSKSRRPSVDDVESPALVSKRQLKVSQEQDQEDQPSPPKQATQPVSVFAPAPNAKLGPKIKAAMDALKKATEKPSTEDTGKGRTWVTKPITPGVKQKDQDLEKRIKKPPTAPTT